MNAHEDSRATKPSHGDPKAPQQTSQDSMFRDVALVIETPKRKLTALSGAILLLALLTAGLLLALWWSTPLLVVPTPSSANVSLSGFAPKVGSSYVLLPGSYEIVATSEGYHPYRDDITVLRAESQSFDLVMSPLPGRLQVNSAISELQMTVDGIALEQTVPGIVKNLERGAHVFRFDHPRYFARDFPFDVEGFDRLQTLDVSLDPAWGRLLLSSVPESQVTVDGQLVGSTPVSAEILQTGSKVELLAPGFNPWKQTLSVAAGDSQSWPEIKLTPADGQLSLSSKPSGASVTVGDEYVGVTPVTAAVPSGKSVEVKVFLQGYQASTRRVEFEPEQKDQLEIVLRPERGEISLEIFPVDSSVYIDGQLQRAGISQLSLLAKPHTIEIRRDGYVSQRKTITPRPKVSQSLQFKLLTEQQNYWLAFPDIVTAPVGIVMHLMRPDMEFLMGASRREAGRRANEIERRVKLDKPFYVSQFEVTNSQYRQFQVKHTSQQLAGNSLDFAKQPVSSISWLDAAKFCNWLSLEAGLNPVYEIEGDRLNNSDISANGYRLPTEAEWAWLARIQDDGFRLTYPWGNKSYPPVAKIENYADQRAKTLLGRAVPNYDDGFIVAAEVGKFPANQRGLYDIGGNVAEWIHDFYGVEVHRGPPLINPAGPPSGTDHVVRGASWKHGSRSELRLSYRERGYDARLDVGMRVVRYIE